MNEFERLKQIIAEEMEIDPEDITEDQSFKEDLEMDNINFLQVMMAMEVEFDVELDPSEIDTFKTVGDALNYITNEY